MKHFHLTIRTPDEKIVESNDVISVDIATETGPTTIYAHHASLTGSILFSRLNVKSKGLEERYLTRRGTIFVDNERNAVTILVVACEKTETIRYEKLEDYLSYIENIIDSGEDLSAIKLGYLEKEKLAIKEQVKVMKKSDQKK